MGVAGAAGAAVGSVTRAASDGGRWLSLKVIRGRFSESSLTILHFQRREKAGARNALYLSLVRQRLFACAARAIGTCAVAVERARENLSGVGLFHPRHLLGRTLRDDAAAFFAAFRTKVNDPIGLFDDVQIMFDDQHRVAERDQAVEHVEKFFDVVKMQPGGGLIEDVKRTAGPALRFAARNSGGRLSQLHVAEADVHQGLEFYLNGRDIFEDF